MILSEETLEDQFGRLCGSAELVTLVAIASGVLVLWKVDDRFSRSRSARG